MLKTIRYVTYAAIVLLVAAVTYAWLAPQAGKQFLQAGGGVGGPFTLQRTDGAPFTEKNLAGKPYLIFFGFTHCPEICPTTLFEASGWMQALGPDADKLGYYFVTVDPERDTGEVLGEYMTSYDPRFVALTGTVEQVEEIKKGYRVFARKVPLEGDDYTVDHTASVYLMHGDGSFSGTIAWQENPDIALEKLRKLIQKG